MQQMGILMNSDVPIDNRPNKELKCGQTKKKKIKKNETHRKQDHIGRQEKTDSIKYLPTFHGKLEKNGYLSLHHAIVPN